MSERSLVGRWLIYDSKSKTWSPERMAEYQVGEKFLPDLLPWGTPIDKISARVAEELGLPADLMIVTGGHDLNCAAVGSGSSVLGSAGFISGSYENMLIPTDQSRYPQYVIERFVC